MYILNTTISLEHTVHKVTLKEIEEVIIPKIMATGLFDKSIFTKVLLNDNPTEFTYSLQLFCANRTSVNQYQSIHQSLFANLRKKYNNQVLFFQSLLKIRSVDSN